MRVFRLLAVLLLLPSLAAAQDGAPPDSGTAPVDGAAGDPAPVAPAPGAGNVVRMNGGDLPAGLLQTPVLTVDEAALYNGSAWGRRVQAELERRSGIIAADNDRIYDELAAEEDALTEARGTLSAAEFRRRAEAFDAHAQTIRAERLEAVQRLNALAEAERRNFFSATIPVFAEVMDDHAAVVVLDQRTVFVSADAIDVTDELIQRIDARIGAGTPAAAADEDVPLPAGSADDPDAGESPDPLREGADPENDTPAP